MDGVPGISFAGVARGKTFTYRFEVRQSRTCWSIALTRSPSRRDSMERSSWSRNRRRRRGRPIATIAVVLSDWSDEPPLQIFLNLKKQSSYYNFAQPTAGDFLKDVGAMGLGKALERRRMWNSSRMNPTDYSDVSAATYTYLMNGAPPAGNWTSIAAPGERVRLRFVGAGTATFFDVRIPGVELTVVSANGRPVEPVTMKSPESPGQDL
ncbi:multicopper oxidase domain-containing protein [Sphingobium herbicidovorans]